MHRVTALLTLMSPTITQAYRFSPAVSALSETRLLSFLGDHECICAIGQSYRDRYPAEDNMTMITDALLSARQQSARLEATGLQALIDSMISKDFEKNNTVLLNGWLLSRTEARQTALYSMLSS